MRSETFFLIRRLPSVTSNGAESGTEEDEEMAAEDDDSEGEDDLPMEMVEDAGRSNKVCLSFFFNYCLLSLLPCTIAACVKKTQLISIVLMYQ